MLRFERNPAPALGWGICLAILAVFLADCFTALGYAEWVLYLLPVSLTLFFWRPSHVVSVGVACGVLLMLGMLTSPLGINPVMALTNRSFGLLTIVVTTGVCYHSVHQKLSQRLQEWLQQGQVELSHQIAGEQTLESLGQHVLRFFGSYINAAYGLFYVRFGQQYQLVATYAVPSGCKPPVTIQLGQGLVGQAAQDQRTFGLLDIREEHVRIGSSLGAITPRAVLVVPIITDGMVLGVLELAFPQTTYTTDEELVQRLGASIGVAIKACHYLRRQQELLEETTRQSEELQAQSEELRVSNEELEEQSRALRETQARLELQQTELEQTNAQLEEQTALLEAQKQDLSRSKSQLELQKLELERSSRYKSEFLANMSHELRTPLNSSLILSKLLADNKEGNLTAEQVKYAKTINGAGNDLLTLINDILDLAKIESGRLEIRPANLALASVVDNLRMTFEPIAADKGLRLRTELLTTLQHVYTDATRLDQVLKNLLSNACKFTEAGEVALIIQDAADGRVEFVVRDTGIGIPEDQREVIFEAFRQADGTTNRKFGGTGLGLSISRELARLLGGGITLQSVVGQGSAFTLSLPISYVAAPAADGSATQSPGSSALTSLLSNHSEVDSRPSEVVASRRHASPPTARAGSLLDQPALALAATDDRDRLSPDRRTILVIEDDLSFSEILADLAHEQNFNCLRASTADEGLMLATRHLPAAIILDVGLPDQSGLSVLDRLKHDVRTRHIPVHIISGSDYAETALSLGAVGYMLKPVKREQLVGALEDLRERLAKAMRRVLVVEDDEVQLNSLKALLGAPEVEVVGVRSASDCLNQLKENTFDCMVLDLSLPDATGFSLLETLSREDRYSFPPVIVYTGRELSSQEEHRLRRYSKSIIIKGARSPERLLDEVTLFLHQVVQEMPVEQQEMLRKAHDRESLLEGRRILVVEDDVRNVFALTSILETKGIRVEIARNGKEALHTLAEADSQSIDLVLMDLMMPEMDGLTAITEIRKQKQWSELPIIALTAKAMKNDQQICLEAGANDYMAKPLDIERLISLIRVWMPRSS